MLTVLLQAGKGRCIIYLTDRALLEVKLATGSLRPGGGQGTTLWGV